MTSDPINTSQLRPGKTLVGVGLAVVATMLGIAGGFFLKHQCFQPQQVAGAQYRKNCYSDITPLYGKRRTAFNPPERPVPFSEGGLAYRDNNFEYPALTGLFVSGANAFVAPGDAKGFFGANAAGLAIFGIGGAAALGAAAADRKRLFLYALGPGMISYAFHNWDLLAIGLLCAGLYAFSRRKDEMAGLAIGLGAAAKLFPGVVLPALVFARLRQRRLAWPMIVASIVGFVVPNLIVRAYAGQDGWWFPWKFQSERGPNFETVWYFAARRIWGPEAQTDFFGFGPEYAKFTNAASIGAFLAGAVLLLLIESRREVFRPYVTGAGLVIIFLLTAKVFSPQYSIWLLPFFVAVRLPWHAYLVYAVTDMFALAAIWALGVALIDKTPAQGYFQVLEIAVYLRYLGLAYVLFWTRRSSELFDAGESPRRARAAAIGREGDVVAY